jgi:hypothetical protein
VTTTRAIEARIVARAGDATMRGVGERRAGEKQGREVSSV